MSPTQSNPPIFWKSSAQPLLEIRITAVRPRLSYLTLLVVYCLDSSQTRSFRLETQYSKASGNLWRTSKIFAGTESTLMIYDFSRAVYFYNPHLHGIARCHVV